MVNLEDYSTPVLETTIAAYNEAYRGGTPLVNDDTYDAMVEELRRRKPTSEILQKPEPEPEGAFGKSVRLPERMLSTQKAYTTDALAKWAAEVERVAGLLGVEPVLRVTPKLDGYAAYYDGKRLYTRGDGYNGQDITHFTKLADIPVTGKGEIVVCKGYFATALADKYENTRNVIASAIKEGELDPAIMLGIEIGSIQFVPFSELIDVKVSADELINSLDSWWDAFANGCEYETDGLVIEAVDEAIRDEMGSTNHHHRWQIAYKRNTEYYDIRVTGLTWQTAKSGRITPVVELEPTRISGVTVSRATGHHAGNVISRGIDDGAIVRVCRSGQVIPYISEVIAEAPFGMVAHPGECPSCGAPTALWEDNLTCTNDIDCPAQVAGKIEHFFKTIGNCDGFGPAVCEKLVAWGVTRVSDVYAMTVRNYVECGFGDKTARNLVDEINASTEREIEDWRFLAAFGIPNFGPASCEKLLQKYDLHDIFILAPEQLAKVEGVGVKTANELEARLSEVSEEVFELLGNFNLKFTDRAAKAGALAGKTICFTGTMVAGSRKDLEANAKAFGATVTTSVSGKTDYLVCGDGVGASKIKAAEKHGVYVMGEAEYWSMVG